MAPHSLYLVTVNYGSSFFVFGNSKLWLIILCICRHAVSSSGTVLQVPDRRHHGDTSQHQLRPHSGGIALCLRVAGSSQTKGVHYSTSSVISLSVHINLLSVEPHYVIRKQLGLSKASS